MTWHTFLHAFQVSGLRELPIAYGVILLLHGGYAAWVYRGFRKREPRG